jgi:hypothetical protein
LESDMPPEFSIRADAVDVDEIMTQIRARIREKRGVDYTEEELRQLAGVKLEKFLDPSQVRSDLLQHFQAARQAGGGASTLPAPPENYVFDDHMVYGSERGVAGRLITMARKLLRPVLKLFINPDPMIHVLHRQSAINAYHQNAANLNFEVMHNLVLELTRLSIEVKNLKMRVESLSGRLDFSDRRARALESVVQYRPGAGPAAEQAETAASAPASTAAPAPRRAGDAAAAGGPIKGEAQRARRRRRRRGRGGPAGQLAAGEGAEAGAGTDGPGATSEPAHDAADAPAAGGAGDGLPFDGGGPGPEGGAAPAAGGPTDQ